MQKLDYTTIFSFRGRAYNEAMMAYPDARENERAAMIRLFDLSADDHLLDVPAGGGYLADGIAKRFGSDIRVTCLEPAKEFGAIIDPAFTVLNAPMLEVPSPAASYTALGSLAGLHHVTDRRPTFEEWSRLLTPHAQLAVADVPHGSTTGAFLNGFVDQHTPQGHDGYFIQDGEFTDMMAKTGFEPMSEDIIQVPWIFPTREAVGEFCKKLFFLETASAAEVTQGIEDSVGLIHDSQNDRWLMNWELVYAFGKKKG